MITSEFQCKGDLFKLEHDKEGFLKPWLEEKAQDLYVLHENKLGSVAKAKVIKLLSEIISSLSISSVDGWLLIQNSSFQPDTRVVRHYKLWKSLKVRGFDVSEFEKTDEYIKKEERGIKFRGGLKINNEGADTAAALMSEERSVYLTYVGHDSNIRNFVSMEWSGNLEDDLELIEAIVEENGVLAIPVGEFDDIEHGFRVISSPIMVENIINSIKGKKR